MRRKLALLAAGLSIASGAVLVACIIADPPTDLPRPTLRKPSIVRSTADPPATRVLGTLPDANLGQGFRIEVEADPTEPLRWQLFVDYDPVTGGEAALAGFGNVPLNPNSPDAGLRAVQMNADQISPLDATRCHVIEGIVAVAFGPEDPHQYDPNLGDSINWFYSPTGDLSTCPIYKTNLDGAFQDVQADTLAIGDGGTE